jgi:predicted ATPase
LEALGRLARQPQAPMLVTTLRQYAPTVLAQLPALLNEAERDRLWSQGHGVTQDRLLRELVEALEALSLSVPLVLHLEDLHWSDVSTLELLAVLVRRNDPARLLVLGTYRPVGLLSPEHPLRATIQEMVVRKQCGQIPLDCLSESAVATYLTQRLTGVFPQLASPSHLAPILYQRTEGHPLFVVHVVDDLLANARQLWQGETRASPEEAAGLSDLLAVVPDSVRQIIVQQFDRLSVEEQQLLAVASIAGAEFSAAVVAAGLADDERAAHIIRVEALCVSLARRQLFIRFSGDRSPSEQQTAERYQFRHSLYRSVVAERITAGHQRLLHQRLGTWKAVTYGKRADLIAAELALHFAAAQDYQQAMFYSETAAQNALRLGANTEAVQHFTRALTLLQQVPATSERDQQELALLMSLGGPLVASKGYADPAVVALNTRARRLCAQFDNPPQLFIITLSSWASALVRGPLTQARRLGEEALALAQELQDPIFFLSAHFALGSSLFYVAEFTAARDHLEDCIRRYDPQQHHFLAAFYGQDIGVLSYAYLAWVLWHLGAPDQARQRMREGLALAQQLDHPYSLALAHAFAAWLHHLLREVPAAQTQAEAAMAISATQGFPFWITAGTICRGWALAEQGQEEDGMVQIRQGLATHEKAGAVLGRPSDIALIARIYGKRGATAHGLAVLEEAFSVLRDTGECAYEADLYLLEGQLTLTSPAVAEGHFYKALEIARRQQAKAWELRAAMSLARLWQQQGKRHEAYALLSEIYGWFSEGFETADLQEAKALWQELQHQ